MVASSVSAFCKWGCGYGDLHKLQEICPRKGNVVQSFYREIVMYPLLMKKVEQSNGDKLRLLLQRAKDLLGMEAVID